MTHPLSGLALAILLVASPCLAATEPPLDEWQTREGIRAEVRADFLREDYARLEARAEAYRAQQLRSPSGLWLLTVFDGGLNEVFDDRSLEWVVIQSRLINWLNAYPRSPTARLAAARMTLVSAWEIRGAGFANTVPDKSWQPFGEVVGKAETYLLKHKDIAAVDPNWYVMMFEIAAAQDWKRERFHKLLDEAYGTWPTFYQMHFAAADYLMPKWHGNAKEIEAFAKRSVEVTRAAEGESMYARIYWYAAQSQYVDFNLIRRSRVNWRRMRAGFEDVMKRYPDAWNLNNYARFSCEAGDWEKTKELMAKIGDKPVMKAWQYRPIFDACRKGQPIDEMIKEGSSVNI